MRRVLSEVLAKVSVTVGPPWVIVTPSAGHWSDWDPACVVEDRAVGQSRGNLDAAPATAQRANHRLSQVPGGRDLEDVGVGGLVRPEADRS